MLVHPTKTTFFADSPAGNASLAGGLAALFANVVLISYVIVAMREDESVPGGSLTKPDSKKDQ